MSRIFVNELTESDSINQVFRLADKQIRVNRQGGKYLLLKLADRTGSIVAMMWNVEDSDFEGITRGQFVHVTGRTQVHQGALQVIATRLDPVDDSEVDLADYEQLDSAANEAALKRLSELLESLSNVHLRSLGKSYLNDEAFMAALQVASAAVSNHHAYPGGLLRHTVDIMELCQIVGPRYQRIDSELLMVGAFLHDLGKIHEISSGGELSYTDRGQLVGHIVIGVQMLGEKIAQAETVSGQTFPEELRLHLEHLIVSHHGQLEYGSPRLPATLEAVALHHIDNLDAKITSYTSLIESDLTSDEHWTNYHPSIGRKLWKKS